MEEIERLRLENARLRHSYKRDGDKRLDEIHHCVQELKEALLGKVNAPEKGIIVRVDRIEQRLSILGWIAKTAGVTAVTAMIHTVWTKLKGG